VDIVKDFGKSRKRRTKGIKGNGNYEDTNRMMKISCKENERKKKDEEE
jgi:hypothetical protein